MMMKNKNQTKLYHHDYFVVSVLSVFVFVFCASNIYGREYFYLSADEYCQFSIAAYFTGIDWSEITSRLGYYSYGYAILLTPLFALFSDVTSIYRGALILNSIIVSSIIPLAYYIAKNWGDISDKLLLTLVLLFAALTSCNIAYSDLGFGEVLLVLLGWANTAVIIKLNKTNTKWYWFVISGFLLVYGFTVHQRFLGVTVAGIIVICIMVIFKKVNYRQLLTFLLTVIVLFIVSLLIKRNIQTNLWLSGNGIQGNDFGGMFAKIKQNFTNIRGLYRAFKNFLGQLWYIGIASFTLVFYSLYELLNVHYKKAREMIVSKRLYSNIDLSHTFILLSFIFTFCISSVAMSGTPVRLDHAIYGRYNDIVYQVLSFFILIKILDRKCEARSKVFAFSMCFIFLASIVMSIINGYPDKYLMLVNDVGLAPFIKNGATLESGIINLLNPSLVCTMVGMLLVYPFKKSDRQYVNRAITVVPIVICLSLSIISGNTFYKSVIENNEHSYAGFKEFVSEAKQEGLPVYFQGIIDDYHCSYFQYYIKDTPIVNSNSVDLPFGNYNMLMYKESYFTSICEYKTSVIDEFSRSEKYVFAQCVKSPETIITSIVPIEWFATRFENDKTEDKSQKLFISDGLRADALLYGPYMKIDSGDYQFEIDCELISNVSSGSVIGTADFSEYIGSEIQVKLNEITIRTDDFSNNRFTIKLPVSVERDIEQFELRVFVSEGVILKITEIRVVVEKKQT